MVTLALIAELWLNLDFPIKSLVILGGGMYCYLGRSALRQRLSFKFIFLFWKLRRAFALRSWHHVTSSCSCSGTNDVYCRDSGDLLPRWGQDKGGGVLLLFSAPLGLSAEAPNSVCSARGTWVSSPGVLYFRV